MIDGKTVWAIIPARSGSKGLPDKNIRDFAGKPLLAWSIEHAEQSKCLDHWVISSDSDRYLDVANQGNDFTLHHRSKWAAMDSATSFDAIRDVLSAPSYAGCPPDIVVVLQPTNPLRADDMIDRMASIMASFDAAMVLTVCEIGTQPWFAWTNTASGFLPMMEQYGPADGWAQPRQQARPCYMANGNGWMMTKEFALTQRFDKPIIPFIEPPEMNQNIDTEEDFRRIERLFLERKGMTHGTPLYAEPVTYPD